MATQVSIIEGTPQYDLTVTYGSAVTASTAVDLRGRSLCGLFIPASFASTSLKFQVATTLGGTYATLTDTTGADISITVAAGKPVALSTAIIEQLKGFRYLVLLAGTAETSKTVTLATKVYA